MIEQVPPDYDPLGRAKSLAQKLAKALAKEDVSDIVPAVAFLTAGIVDQFCDEPAKAKELITSMRRLEDQLIDALGLTADLQ